MSKNNLRKQKKILEWVFFLSGLCLAIQSTHMSASAQLLDDSIRLSKEESQMMSWISYEVSSHGQVSIVDHKGFHPQPREYDRSGLKRDNAYYAKLLKRTKQLFDKREDIRLSACTLPYYDVSDEEKSLDKSSCDELITAALCRFSSKAKLEDEALKYCGDFSKLFEETVSKAKKADIEFKNNGYEINPYLTAINHRCLFGFAIKELEREKTLQYCLKAYGTEKEKLPTSSDPEASSVGSGVLVSNLTAYLNRIGFLYQEEGRHGKAVELVTSYLDFIEPLSLDKSTSENSYTEQAKVYALEILGDVYTRSNRYSEAVESYKPIVKDDSLSNPIGSQETNYRVRNKLATALLGDSQLTEAEEEFRVVIQYQEERGPDDSTYSNSGALRVQEDNRDAYDKLQALLIAQNRYDEALEITDRRRSFLFSGRFRDVDSRRPQNPNTRPEFTFREISEEAKQQEATFVIYSKSNFLLDLDGNGLNRTEDTKEYINIWVVKPDGNLAFKNISVDSDFNVSEANQLKVTDVRMHVGRVALIISAITLCVLAIKAKELKNKTGYILVSTISGLIIVATFFVFRSGTTEGMGKSRTASLLTQMVSQTSSATRGDNVEGILANDVCSSSRRCLEKMYELLIEPVRTELPRRGGEEHIIFVPDEELNNVSFAALTSSDNRYLIEDYVISTIPSIRAINLLRLRAETKGVQVSDSLVVGNPIMPKKSKDEFSEATTLQQLPYAEQEAKKVANLLGTEPLIGVKATEENVIERLTQARYIHLATHGLPNIDTSDLPSFALTPPEIKTSEVSGSGFANTSGDGFLDTNEIYRTPLNGELAVLSACDTSAGQGTVEGNLSLARPFLTNGIPSVVASLWQVRDESTSKLMSYFYQNLENTPNKSVALRDAILATKDEYPNPREWAGFMLIGLSELPEVSREGEAKQVVGTISCSPLYYRGGFNSNSRNLIKAVLEKSSNGYQLRMTEESGSITFLELDSKLVVESGEVAAPGSTERVPLNLYPAFSDEVSLQVSPEGNFEVSIQSRRSSCDTKGQLEFLGSAKTDLF